MEKLNKLLCPQCPAKKQEPMEIDSLREHIARNHLEIRLFTCPKCQMGFITPHVAHHHMRIDCKVEIVQTTAFTNNLLSHDALFLTKIHELEQLAIFNRISEAERLQKAIKVVRIKQEPELEGAEQAGSSHAETISKGTQYDKPETIDFEVQVSPASSSIGLQFAAKPRKLPSIGCQTPGRTDSRSTATHYETENQENEVIERGTSPIFFPQSPSKRSEVNENANNATDPPPCASNNVEKEKNEKCTTVSECGIKTVRINVKRKPKDPEKRPPRDFPQLPGTSNSSSGETSISTSENVEVDDQDWEEETEIVVPPSRRPDPFQSPGFSMEQQANERFDPVNRIPSLMDTISPLEPIPPIPFFEQNYLFGGSSQHFIHAPEDSQHCSQNDSPRYSSRGPIQPARVYEYVRKMHSDHVCEYLKCCIRHFRSQPCSFCGGDHLDRNCCTVTNLEERTLLYLAMGSCLKCGYKHWPSQRVCHMVCSFCDIPNHAPPLCQGQKHQRHLDALEQQYKMNRLPDTVQSHALSKKRCTIIDLERKKKEEKRKRESGSEVGGSRSKRHRVSLEKERSR